MSNVVFSPSFDSHQSSSDELTPERFREIGYRAVDAMCDYYGGIESRAVLPDTTPGEVAALFDGQSIPQHGEDADSILDDWSDRVLPNLTTVGSPRHFVYVNGSGTMIGAIAEALAASVNTNAGAWKLGPAATEVERQSIRWIAELLGYPADCGGVFLSGGTMANFTCILTALRNKAGFDIREEGLQGPNSKGRFLLYMSDHEGHSSVTRVVDMLNLGRNSVRLVPSKADFTIDEVALADMIDADIAAGHRPFCVVAQIGSINVGCIDPIDSLADVCASRDIWLHGDGACGGPAACLPELSRDFQGLERLDSLSLDPHKWLSVPYDAGCALVRKPEHLYRTFSMKADYLQGTLPDDRQGFDYLEYCPEMSRPFRALKVWMTLRHRGADGIRNTLRKNIAQARLVHDLVSAHADFKALHEPTLFMYSFQYRPRGLEDDFAETNEYLDILNQRIADALLATGQATVMTTRINGRVVLRLSICSHRTRDQDIRAIFDLLASLGGGIDQDNRRFSPSGIPQSID